MKNSGSRAAVTLLGLAVLGLSACSSYEMYMLENLPPEARIEVDGRADDWRGLLSMIADADASLGVANDAENLYVCLVAESSLLKAQIMESGLTVWFDPHGGTKKTLGIRNRGRAGEDGQRPDLEIIRGKESDHQTMETANALGIEVRLAPTNGLVVYELKIPLLPSEAHPLAVGAPPGQVIGVGIDTVSPDDRKVIRRSLGGLPPMGGGSGWERGGGPGGYDMTPQAPKRMKIWGRVRLSSAPEANEKGLKPR